MDCSASAHYFHYINDIKNRNKFQPLLYFLSSLLISGLFFVQFATKILGFYFYKQIYFQIFVHFD